MRADLQLASSSSAALSRPEHSIRVVLAEDHALMRRSLRLLLDCEEHLEVVAEAWDVSSATRGVHDYHPDVLVLDLQMPHGSSLDAIWRLREQAPSTEIVALTMEQNPAFARHAIEAGA
jgi:DNA-binding NarL/FixJ family response regulator